LLAFARQQTLDPSSVSPNKLISDMEDLVRRTVGPGIKVETVLAIGLWQTLCDPHQLENAVLNLCINGRDAMPGGGRLTIETANTWLDAHGAQERDMEPGQYVAVCVTDTGTGMTPDVIARAFDPFFTTKPTGQGTGLGLSMIYGFAKQSGGQARIYSEPGMGTTVRIYLPRQHGATESDVPIVKPTEAPRATIGETVLIIDDEPTLRMLVTEVLEEMGYSAIEAADSISGLKVLQSDVRIDLLITDVGLPGGMNGRQMADAARVTRPKLKVLFVTGYAENAAVGNGHLDAGMHLLTKPFALDTLAHRIKSIITGN
jgi:CheY-like chemotaxis protein